MFPDPGVPQRKVTDTPAELISTYPTLLELCGLSPITNKEGIRLLRHLLVKNLQESLITFTTFGKNNHAIIT